MSGLARSSVVLGERALADKAVDLVEGYAGTLPASGATGMGIYGWREAGLRCWSTWPPTPAMTVA